MTTFDADGHRLTEVEPNVWELDRDDETGIPARVLANGAILEHVGDDMTLDQLRNVAEMPGAVAPALCMPDGHQGYGFPVGGVAAFDAEDGCISPAGIGFDINCGVRMVRTNLTYEDVRGREEELVDALFDAVPCGLGGGGVHEGTHTDLEEALERGVDWCVEAGYAVREDRLHCEDEGMRPDADPDAVPKKAKDRGASQMGSLGSGNHFLEVQRVTDVYDDETADAFGLAADQVVVLIHCGSRGLGHQVCSDYLRRIEQEHPEFLDSLPDKDLAAAPAGSALADEYYGAMCAAINFAWVNRQLVTHAVRETFADVFDAPDWQALEMDLLYDVAHNIAKKESHEVCVGPEGLRLGGGGAADARTDDGDDLDGAGERVERDLYVHRKGATRAFPAGHPEVPEAYRAVGQPVIIPGSMGAGSYILRGGEQSMGRSFGSTAHGAGRLMSRTQAKDEYWGGDVQDDLREDNEIYVKAASGATIAEEAPGVYKDVDEVVGVSDALGIGDLVVRTYPVCNIKG
jgi:tRNA-splicing ligase RtcB